MYNAQFKVGVIGQSVAFVAQNLLRCGSEIEVTTVEPLSRTEILFPIRQLDES